MIVSISSLGRTASIAATLAGCTTWPPPTTPMPTRRIAPRCAATSRCVLLPGALSRAEEFVTEGFVADLQAAAPGCEVVLADAHLGYFVEGTLLPRLREDVVQPQPVPPVPAAQPGAKPWLIGISLGGLAALAYAMHHPDDVAGVLALAPYLGRRELLRDIMAAGGPAHWRALPARPGEAHEELEDDLWRWLARPNATAPPVYLGYGRDDRFADAHRLLQALLPAGHTDVTAGGHDWGPWRVLFRQWLQRGLIGGSVVGGGGGTGGSGNGYSSGDRGDGHRGATGANDATGAAGCEAAP